MKKIVLKRHKYCFSINEIINPHKIIIVVASLLLTVSIATAGNIGKVASSAQLHPLISLLGGFGNVHAGHSQTYLDTDNVFTYYSKENNKNTGLVGVFLGEEFTIKRLSPSFFLQAGLEYDYFGNFHLNGTNTVGIEPTTSTLYRYNYTFQAQQIMAVAKILTTTHQFYHPYFSLGLGASFNHAGIFDATTLETGSINLTPTFHDNTQAAFSYSLGIGIDASLNQHLRVGLGYRFTDMGKASFGDGAVVIHNYGVPTSFTLMMPHVFSNQLVAQISYLI